MTRRPYAEFPDLEIETTARGVTFRCWKCYEAVFAPNEAIAGTTNHVVVHRHGSKMTVVFQNAPMN